MGQTDQANKPAQSRQIKNNSHSKAEELTMGATEKVLQDIRQLYETGIAAGPGSLGLRQIASSSQLRLPPMRTPRRKVTVMIVGNHSAGKSSFINWYIGEDVQKTGVAIETRGFTFVTSGKKRETLTGDATIRYYDFLAGITKFDGILPNLSTEISTSKERSFPLVDLIDTPGLVDGNMLYPFPVEDAILYLADHCDLILVFFDPIGQATCKRTMQVVEQLNHSNHLEKIYYFMAKADMVEKEHDRQRVLIQVTQNLASRIRNSHAFNLPTFYLPRTEGPQPNIPNAIEEVCKEVDKSISMAVQKSLRLLKEDCERILTRADQVVVEDRKQRDTNRRNTLQGVAFTSLAGLCGVLLVACVVTFITPTACRLSRGSEMCSTTLVQALIHLSPLVTNHFKAIFTFLLCSLVALLLLSKLLWQTKPVFNKRDLRKIDEFKASAKLILEQEQHLYDAYFATLSNAER